MMTKNYSSALGLYGCECAIIITEEMRIHVA